MSSEVGKHYYAYYAEDVWVKCEICGKGFDNYEALIAHLYTHIPKLNEQIKEKIKKAIAYRMGWESYPYEDCDEFYLDEEQLAEKRKWERRLKMNLEDFVTELFDELLKSSKEGES